MPGAVRIHKDPGATQTFLCIGSYQSFNKIPSLEIGGVRATKLGLNVYSTKSSGNGQSSENNQHYNNSQSKYSSENKVWYYVTVIVVTN